MWLAIRSSCSAPSYFRSTGRYLDGGLIANNPTLDALSEIHKHEKYFKTVSKDDGKNKITNLKVIVSVGMKILSSRGLHSMLPFRIRRYENLLFLRAAFCAPVSYP